MLISRHLVKTADGPARVPERQPDRVHRFDMPSEAYLLRGQVVPALGQIPASDSPNRQSPRLDRMCKSRDRRRYDGDRRRRPEARPTASGPATRQPIGLRRRCGWRIVLPTGTIPGMTASSVPRDCISRRLIRFELLRFHVAHAAEPGDPPDIRRHASSLVRALARRS